MLLLSIFLVFLGEYLGYQAYSIQDYWSYYSDKISFWRISQTFCLVIAYCIGTLCCMHA